MNKIRIIPAAFQDGMIVQSKKFEMHRSWDTSTDWDRLCSWNVDEVIFLNISESKMDFKRDDLNFKI